MLGLRIYPRISHYGLSTQSDDAFPLKHKWGITTLIGGAYCDKNRSRYNGIYFPEAKKIIWINEVLLKKKHIGISGYIL